MLSDRDYMRPGDAGRPWQRPLGSVIKPLIWANVLVFLVTGLGRPGDASTFSGGFFELLHLHPYYIHRWEVWRLGTYMFVHGGLTHLFFNMWGLHLFGRLVEDRLGPQRFLRLYFISGVLGGLAWLLANWWSPIVVSLDPRLPAASIAALQRLGAEVVSYQGEVIATGSASAFLNIDGVRVVQALGGVVGASGAIFGVMMAAAMTAPNLRILLLLPPVPMKLKTFVALYALIEAGMAWTSATGHMGSKIAHLAHLGGLAGAFLYMKHLGHSSPWGFCRNLLDAWRGRRTRRQFQKLMGGAAGGGGPASTEVDRILDKIGHEGMQSLTDAERQTLQEAGRRFRDNRSR
jgi:membrane associated rhomboid family serine protease